MSLYHDIDMVGDVLGGVHVEQQGMHNDAMILGGPLSMAQSHHDINYHPQTHGGDGSYVNNTNNNQLYSQGMNYANSSHNCMVRRMGQGIHTYRIIYHGIWGLTKCVILIIMYPFAWTIYMDD